MSDLADRIAAREDMRYQENLRVNSEQARLRVLSRDEWDAFRKAFYDECDSISNRSQFTQLDCEDPQESSCVVNRRLLSGHSVLALEFIFDPAVPCIYWQDHYNKKTRKRIDFAIEQTRVFLVAEGKGFNLQRFVEQRLDAVTRPF
jgi:hypothetical protein